MCIRDSLDSESFLPITSRVKSFKLVDFHRPKDSKDIQILGQTLESNDNLNEINIENLSKDNVEIIHDQSMSNIMKKYLSTYEKNPHETKYISFNNQVAHEFNLLARNAIHNIDPRKLYVKNDLVHVTENNYFYSLWNGDFLEILNVGNTIEGPTLHLSLIHISEPTRRS